MSPRHAWAGWHPTWSNPCRFDERLQEKCSSATHTFWFWLTTEIGNATNTFREWWEQDAFFHLKVSALNLLTSFWNSTSHIFILKSLNFFFSEETRKLFFLLRLLDFLTQPPEIQHLNPHLHLVKFQFTVLTSISLSFTANLSLCFSSIPYSEDNS